ncbi:MAG TPA: outer membrane beta-barrel protein [Phnomibacter sp.]|nr:outer membrane beta-barrel protein [Phnomibacter sp.]
MQWALAQQKPVGIIMGNVLDSTTGKPMEGVTVQVQTLSATGGSKTFITKADGFFSFIDLAFGYYSLSLSSVGFSKIRLDSIHLRTDRYDFNLGDLKMYPDIGELQNVTVFVEKPLLENRDGKMTFNAGESALSAGSTTADLMKNLPLVSADPNGKLLLRGKEPRILIDDKPVDLNGQQLADLLESLPGGSIDKIEIMQNPPPEYGTDAGGVINIVTKKGKIGFTGRATISAGTRGEGNIGANLAYRSGKWNLSGTVNMGGSLLTGYSNSYRTNMYKDSTNQFNTAGKFENRSTRPNIRLQADYDANKQHQFSWVFQAAQASFDNESNTRYENYNRYETLWKLSNRNVHASGSNYSINPQFTWNVKTKRPGESFRLVTGVGTGPTENDRHFFQQFLDPVSMLPNGVDSNQQQVTDNRFFNSQSRISYNRNLFSKFFSLNTGAGFITNQNDNSLQTYYFDKTSNEWMHTAKLSNEFLFNQSVSYVRAGFTVRNQKGWRLIAYIQPEFTQFNISSKTADTSASNHYTNWLPGITLRKDLNKEHNLSLVYRKTIRRPSAYELNPAIDYGDPYNLRFGNPTLKPSGSHIVDLNYGYAKGKSFINASLGYNLIEDIIASIRSLGSDGKTFTTFQNIASKQEYEFAFWMGYSFSRVVRVNASTGYTYNQYREEDIQKLGYRNGGSFNASINYSLIFSGVFSMDGNIQYSSYADPQGRSRSNVNTNFGVQHKFLDRRLILAFNVMDPFTSQEYTTTTTGTNFHLESFRSSKTRNFRLSIAWQLNKVVGLPKTVIKKK